MEQQVKAQQLNHLDGTRFCLVCMNVLNEATQEVKLTPIHGVAKVLPDCLVVVEPSGSQHVIPDSALPSILPSDGTALLEDADHYVIVKIGVL
ncbi:MAG: hypothetical protein ACI9OU_000714 [Candidatus Promineifilaceae bacterium]|jgi:hypothetical protein